MKKYGILILTMTCLAVLTACGGSKQTSQSSAPAAESQTGANNSITATFTTEGTTYDSEPIPESTQSIEGTLPPSMKVRPMFGLYMNEKNAAIFGLRMKRMEEEGLKTDLDLENTVLKAGEVKRDIVLHHKDAQLVVAAVNPYENEATLADCIVCSVSSQDKSGVFSMDSDYQYCGQASYDDLTYRDVYQKTENKLVYKTWVLTPVDMEFSLEPDSKGDKILDPSGDCELTLDFENGVLTRFTYVLPDICYSGMEDNLDEDSLDSIEQKDLDIAVQTRNDILDELKKAFEEADLDVDINDESGEIVMGNDILFALDSYELSDEGKDYLDRFMEAYASVVFGEKYSDSIKEVRYEGHTDSSVEEDYNLKLSQNRADAILSYCLESEKNNMTADQKASLKKLATAVGYASSDPVYDENGKEDPDKSRRAAIKFFVKVD